jgi:hypothetical protein
MTSRAKTRLSILVEDAGWEIFAGVQVSATHDQSAITA